MKELTEREKIIEHILKSAYNNSSGRFYPEKERLFHGRPMDECNRITTILQEYGKIEGLLLNGQWIAFKIDKRGIDFIDVGGYEAKKMKEDQTKEIDELKKKNLMLQNGKLIYDKKTRFIAWLSLIISVILACFKIFG